MKTFSEFLTEDNGVFPARETRYWISLRRQRETYTKLVKLDARKLQAAYVASNPTFANSLRDVKTHHIKDVIAKGEKIDAYPNIVIMPNGRVDVADGRHRLALAAERGEKIVIGVEPTVTDAMLAPFR